MYSREVVGEAMEQVGSWKGRLGGMGGELSVKAGAEEIHDM
jgi:hypothetical protein